MCLYEGSGPKPEDKPSAGTVTGSVTGTTGSTDTTGTAAVPVTLSSSAVVSDDSDARMATVTYRELWEDSGFEAQFKRIKAQSVAKAAKPTG
jgi:hypothetical protein